MYVISTTTRSPRNVSTDKDVHKAAGLDVVGWFTLTPSNGPEHYVLPIHTQLLQDHNESALLLAFHPQSVASATSSSGKLPITIYESSYEAPSISGNDDDGDDKHMQNTSEQSLQLRFKEVPYTVETGDAEMIAVDFVARGGGNASAPEATSGPATASATGTAIGPSTDTLPNGKSKGKASQTNGTISSTMQEQHTTLSAADEDLIATLTTKANAVRMLRQRLALLRTYLASIPEDNYLKKVPSSPQTNVSPDPAVSHAILRSIASLLARLPLLLPSLGPTATTTSPLAREAAAERTDVALTTLLGNMGGTLRVAQSLGRKVGAVESARNLKNNKGLGNVGGMLMPMPMMENMVMDMGDDRGMDDWGGGMGSGDGAGALGGIGGGAGGGFGGFGGVFLNNSAGGGGGSANSRPPVDIGALLAAQGGGRRG